MPVTAREEALLALNRWEGFHAGMLKSWPVEPEEAFAGNESLWERVGLPPRARELVARLRSEGWATAEEERADRIGAKLLFWGGDGYPARLVDLERPPAVLYAMGKWPAASRMDAVVGTRRCSPYGSRIARELGCLLAGASIGVLSGGALGIDGAAHAGALEAEGATVAVLGTGVDLAYPPQHEELFARIRERGTLLSEFPLSTASRAWRFPRRNRLIAALADRLAVVEAPEKSGAIVTAKIAMDLGREVWVVPGRIDEWVCKGSNSLLWDGAHPLVEPEDLARVEVPQQASLFGSRPEEEETSPLLHVLRSFGDQAVDILASKVKMSAADALAELTRLEALGLARRTIPGRWSADPSTGRKKAGHPIL